jgi:hypothetical protein
VPAEDSIAARRRDALVVLVLVATAFVIGAPILGGGAWTYFDNPPHLAELHSLAHEGAGGWSNVGFAGLSLDTLHSPMLWRALALLDGTPLLVPVYASLLCLGLAAPAVAIYWVARRRIAWPWAAALAYVVLIQRPALVGSASATGGMWTFFLASGAWVMLADGIARPSHGARDRVAIAALLGFIGLVHLFVLEAAVLLFAVHAAWTLVRPRGARPTLRALAGRDISACALAAAASAAYWLLVALGADAADFGTPQNLPPTMLLKLLVAPTDLIDQVMHVPMSSALPLSLESIPMVLLLAAGAAGAALCRRGDRDPLPAYGAVAAAVVLGALLLARPLDLHILGPVSWRFSYFVRLGAALAALPVLARLPVPRVRRPLAAITAALALASGLLWGAPLRDDIPDVDGPEMDDVRALWRWLGDHRDGHRVYIQDTFMAEPRTLSLAHSHVLALTWYETGVEPIGPYYGVVPSRTASSTASQFGLLFAGPRAEVLAEAPLSRWDASVLIASTPTVADALTKYGWTLVDRIGRFSIWRQPPGPPPATAGVREGTQRIAFELDADAVVACSYHWFLRIVDAPPGARLALGDFGRLAIVGLPPGHHRVVVEYAPPRVWPVSVAAWLGLAALAMVAYRRPRSAS